MSLSFEDFLAHTAANAVAFDAAIASAAPEGRVPPCPDWATPDLRFHLAGVLAFWHGQLRPEAFAAEPYMFDSAAVGAASSVTSIAETLCAILSAVGPDVPCWNWSGSNPTSAWVARRMAQETAVHRVDAQQIDGAVAGAIDHELSVDELMDVFVAAPAAMAVGDAPVLEVAVEAQRRWVIELGAEGVRRTERAPGTRLSGSGSGVLLALWGRSSDAQWRGSAEGREAWTKLARFE